MSSTQDTQVPCALCARPVQVVSCDEVEAIRDVLLARLSDTVAEQFFALQNQSWAEGDNVDWDAVLTLLAQGSDDS